MSVRVPAHVGDCRRGRCNGTQAVFKGIRMFVRVFGAMGAAWVNVQVPAHVGDYRRGRCSGIQAVFKGIRMSVRVFSARGTTRVRSVLLEICVLRCHSSVLLVRY